MTVPDEQRTESVDGEVVHEWSIGDLSDSDFDSAPRSLWLPEGDYKVVRVDE